MLKDDSMNTSQIGNIGESKTLCELTKLGVPCYIPFGDGNTSDLIADFNGKLNRIQVKTTNSLSENGVMEWKITRQEGYHGNRVTYDLNSIDFFALYCVENDILCFVPFDNNFPSSTISIRPDDYNGIRKNCMRFASDFSINKIINAIS